MIMTVCGAAAQCITHHITLKDKKVDDAIVSHYRLSQHGVKMLLILSQEMYDGCTMTSDTRLFTEISHNPCHVLQALLADDNYNLRYRPHNKQLPDRMSHLTNCNFIVRMLFCDSYWL